MANFNKVFLMGNLTRDPELRYTPTGTAVAGFGLAVNRRWKSQGGEDREETVFVDVNAFGRQAEVISEYLSKGRPIFVEGRLRLEQWEDRSSGQKRSKLTVTLENFQFLGSPPQGAQKGAGRPQQAKAPDEKPPVDDDIPF